MDVTLAEPRFVDGKPMLLAGLQGRFTPGMAAAISELWGRFGASIGRIPNEIPGAAYGVTMAMDESGAFEYMAGVPVSKLDGLPAEFGHIEVPAQHYAVFAQQEPVSAIAGVFEAIFGQWLPRSGYQPGDGPCLERYDEHFDPETGLGGFEIWLPVKGAGP